MVYSYDCYQFSILNKCEGLMNEHFFVITKKYCTGKTMHPKKIFSKQYWF